MSKPTDFWAGFGAALSKQGEKRPTGKGWRSLDEVSAEMGFYRTTVIAKLSRGIKSGLIERFDGHTIRNGRLTRTTWYRPK